MVNDDNTLKIVFLPNFQDVLKKLKEPTKSEVKKKLKKLLKTPKLENPCVTGGKAQEKFMWVLNHSDCLINI